jgi:hypothetical protein
MVNRDLSSRWRLALLAWHFSFARYALAILAQPTSCKPVALVCTTQCDFLRTEAEWTAAEWCCFTVARSSWRAHASHSGAAVLERRG